MKDRKDYQEISVAEKHFHQSRKIKNINTQKCRLLYTDDILIEKEIKETEHFTVASKKKNLQITLTKQLKDLCYKHSNQVIENVV